jgi:hypothetical protein
MVLTSFQLVIVIDFYFVRTSFAPNEADSPLVVNANTVLSLPIASKLLKPIAGHGCKAV